MRITLLVCLFNCAAVVLADNSQHKLLASDGKSNDAFGFSVAIHANTVVVGAMRADRESEGADYGAAYVYSYGQDKWHERAKLIANDGQPGDTLGGKVAIYKNLIALGAIRHDAKGEDSGAVYVFEKSNDGWQQQAKIVSDDVEAGDAFGQSISLGEGILVIGAPHDDDKGESSGSIYVYSQTGDKWQLQSKLIAPDGQAGDVFGISTAISADSILVGADLHDEKANNAGAAYVYVRSANGWRLQDKLMAEDAGDTDIFGVRVALDGNTALISARRDDHPEIGEDAGSAYVFVRQNDKWKQQAKLVAPDVSADDRFGRDVSISGNTALIGAMLNDDKGSNSGAAYVYTRNTDQWEFSRKILATDAAPNDRLGSSIALTSHWAILSAPGNDEKADDSGAVYVVEIQ